MKYKVIRDMNPDLVDAESTIVFPEEADELLGLVHARRPWATAYDDEGLIRNRTLVKVQNEAPEKTVQGFIFRI